MSKLSVFKLFTVSLFSVLLISCGGGQSDANKKADSLKPTADASIVGLVADTIATNGASEKSFNARANNEITLTAKNSQAARTPILTFEWTQLSGTPVNWVIDTNDTRKFTAPNVRTPTQLRFQVKVTDANKNSDTDTLTLNLTPSDDVDQFLENPTAPTNQLRVLAALRGGTSTGSVIQPFSIQANYIAHWRNRLRAMDQTQVYSETLSGSFPQNFSPAANYVPFTEPKNPILAFQIRPVSRDDINQFFNDAASYNRRLESKEISSAYIEIQLQVVGTPAVNFELFAINSSGALIPGNQILTPLSPSSTSNAPSPAFFSKSNAQQKTQATNGALLQTWNGEFSASLLSESILAALGIATAKTANNYYLLLDPTAQFTQLSSWLNYAGFNGTHAQLESNPAISHAVYFNNYDLGYGRTMWMREDANGNVFSYVTNFPSVESALSCLNDFSVFAMEYSNNPDVNGRNAKIVKFYAFVPDKLTGNYVRTATIDIDGRGEKPIPEACAGCHQGYVNNTQFSNLADADLEASFLPFDVSGFLFGKAQNAQFVEPGFNASYVTPEQLERHTKEKLESEFRKLNLGVLKTYAANPSAHTEAIRLIHGWYGDLNPTFGNQSSSSQPAFKQSFSQPSNQEKIVPIDQLPNQAFDGNYVQPGWIGQENLYRNVYARYCRTCHTQFSSAALNFANYSDFINNPKLIDQVFQQGLMPFSRLTMDRFWTPPPGGTSAANLLRAHLQGLNQTVPTAPGLPVPRFKSNLTAPTTGQTIVLDASPSLFANTYSWQLTPPNGSNAQLSNTTGLTTSFTPDIAGANYQIRLTVTNANNETANFSQTITSDNRIPVADCFTANTSTLTSAGLLANIPVTSVITNPGDGGLRINAVTQGSLGTVTFDQQSVSYKLNNPFVRGVDTISYRLIDADGSLSTSSPSCNPTPTAGFGTIRIDSTNAGISAPANLTATVDPINNTSSTHINWLLSPAVDGYNIYRNSTAAGAPLNTVLLTSANFIDTGLLPNTTYNYSVIAVINGFKSNLSTTSATTLSLTPSNLFATGVATNQIDLIWTAPPGNATRYNIYRDASSVPLTTLLAPTTNFSDFSVTGGNQYSYRVTALDGINESPAIGPVTGFTFPDAPTVVNAAVVSTTQINVNWAPVNCNGTLSYSVAPVGGGAAIPTTATNVSVTGLMPNTTYRFVVQALCNGRASAQSIPSSPVTTPPDIPTNLAATPVSTSQINLTWTGVTGAVNNYIVYRNGSPIFTISPPVTNFSDTGLNSGSQYTYTVSATVSGVETNQSTFVATATFPDAPGVPGGNPLSDTEIFLGWTPAFCSTIPNYILIPSGLAPRSVGNVTGLLITGLTPNTTYTFKVRVVCNGLTSADSPDSIPLTTRISAPTGLTATTLGVNEIGLNWDPILEITDGYNIYRDNELPIFVSGSSVSSFMDSDINNGTAFDYRISVIIGGVESVLSPVVTGYTFPSEPNPPTARALSSSQIDVAWDTSVCSGPAPIYTLTTIPGSSVTTTDTTFSVTGLLPQSTYIFNLRVTCNGLTSTVSANSNPATTFP